MTNKIEEGKIVKQKQVIEAEIISNKKVAPDHFVMKIASPWLGEHSSPGQFVMVSVREKTMDPLLRIPLGIHRMDKNGIQLLYKVVGTSTELLSFGRKGGRINLVGPLGNGFDLAPVLAGGDTMAVVVAGGHGIAPLYALIEAVKAAGRKVIVFIGSCEEKHVLCSEGLEKLGIKVHVATEDGTCGHKGYVTDCMKKHLRCIPNDEKLTTIYGCGPRPMLAALAKDAKTMEIPAQVSLDAYMACGIGACLGCAIRTVNGFKLVCKDGPVFDAEEIQWRP